MVPEPETPSPSDNHGWVWRDSVLEPLWTKGSVLPQRLVDILESTSVEEETSSDEDSDTEDNTEYLEDDVSDDE